MADEDLTAQVEDHMDSAEEEFLRRSEARAERARELSRKMADGGVPDEKRPV